MAGKAKREPKRQAATAALVDLNIWDVLFGLTGPAEAPAVPEADGRPAGDGPAAPVRAAGRKAGRGSRRVAKREGEAGPAT